MKYGWEYGWELVALFSVIVAIAVPLMSPHIGNSLAKEDNTVVIKAYKQEAGGFKPNTIWIKKGQRVKLVVESMDVTHGFMVRGLGINMGVIDPGEKKTVEFVATKEGVYPFRCTVMCSPYHFFMRGAIIVSS